MNWDVLLFVITPYVALTLAVAVTAYRAIYRPFTVSSLSSQLLERKQLYWGSIPFHWGVILILLGHLLALLIPEGILWWNAVPVRLYLLEGSGIMLGVWALAGILILLYRRLGNSRVQAVTTPMDLIVLLLLLLQLLSGVLIATSYRFGSSWGAAVLTPYLRSVLTLQPRLELVADLSWVIKLHVAGFFVLLAVFPFSRLIHIITVPLGYLFRPWQIVIWIRKKRSRQGAF